MMMMRVLFASIITLTLTLYYADANRTIKPKSPPSAHPFAAKSPCFHSLHHFSTAIAATTAGFVQCACKFVANHGEFRSTFSRRNFLFNQPFSHQKTWQLHSTRTLGPACGAVKGLILANVVVFLLWRVADEKFMMQNFTVQWDNFNSRRYHTLITSAFSHVRVIHIILNMIGLYFRGKRIEQRFGPGFLLKLYLVGAFVSSVSFLVDRAFLTSASKDNRLSESDRSKVPALGASGAVSAIHMLDILLSPMDIFTLLLLIHEIWEDIDRVKRESQIGGAAHLGGYSVGIIAWAWLRKWRS